MFNFLIPKPNERVSVLKDDLERSIALVGALPCTTIRCKNASDYGRVVCGRCEALDSITQLSANADEILISSGLG